METLTRDQIESYLENALNRKEYAEDQISHYQQQLNHYKGLLEDTECEIQDLKGLLKK